MSSGGGDNNHVIEWSWLPLAKCYVAPYSFILEVRCSIQKSAVPLLQSQLFADWRRLAFTRGSIFSTLPFTAIAQWESLLCKCKWFPLFSPDFLLWAVRLSGAPLSWSCVILRADLWTHFYWFDCCVINDDRYGSFPGDNKLVDRG